MKRFLSLFLWVFIGILGTFLGGFFLDNPDLMLQVVESTSYFSDCDKSFIKDLFLADL